MIRLYRKFERVMDHPNTQALYRYWNELRGDRDAPSRSEIDPRRIAGALETMFIFELLDDGQLRFRLAGTALCEMLGMEARGLMAEAMMAPDHGAHIADLGARVLGAPGVGVMRVRALDGAGTDWAGELLLLPLRSELGEMTRLMGCLSFEGAHRRNRPAPSLRLRCQGTRLLPVSAEEAEGAADPLGARPAMRADAPFAGLAEAPQPFRRAASTEVESRPRLTAIDGNPTAPRRPDGAGRPSLRIVRD